MSHTDRLRGFGPKEVLLALLVIVTAAALLMLIGRKTVAKDAVLNEATRMRSLYRALAFYEEQNDSQPAPSLLSAAQFDPNRLDFVSQLDPFKDVTANAYPLDPGIVNDEHAPYRISFSYLLNFVRNEKIKIKSWEETRSDPLIGEIANEWLGSVQPGQPFEAEVSGTVLRIDTDGAVYTLKDRGGPKPLGDAQDLFIKR